GRSLSLCVTTGIRPTRNGCCSTSCGVARQRPRACTSDTPAEGNRCSANLLDLRIRADPPNVTTPGQDRSLRLQTPDLPSETGRIAPGVEAARAPDIGNRRARWLGCPPLGCG